MIKRGAQFISVLFHPLLMPTWLMIVLLIFFPTSVLQAQSWGLIMLLIFFGMTFILPVLNLVFFKLTGTISSLQMFKRKERILPSILVTLLYAFLASMFYWKFYAIPVFFKLMAIVTALSAIVTITTFFFKISAHAVGMCGLAGILLAIATLASAQELIFPALGALILAGVTMSSRLLLNAHTLDEVGWGGGLGFAIGFGGMIILF
jgi:hypothetical protein